MNGVEKLNRERFEVLKKIVNKESIPQLYFSNDDLKWLLNQVEKYENALMEIDTHIRSDAYPEKYIVDTLKNTLPEYRE